MAQPEATAAHVSTVRPSPSPGKRLAAGLSLCVLIAVIAQLAGQWAPVVGAPLFAIALGIATANLLGQQLGLASLRIGEVAKNCLKSGIVLIGASLDVGDIIRVSRESLPVMAVTISGGLFCVWYLGRRMRVHWRMQSLIGVGTVICGASAIAAIAPVARARAEEIAYSISVIFVFNMVAVFLFPALGHLMSLSDQGFGMWAGTAVNDTSAVVASGFAYSQLAGTFATIVKLTRTTLIIPIVLLFGLTMPWIDSASVQQPGHSLGHRILKTVPIFIIVFVIASLLKTMGLVGPALAPMTQELGRWVLVLALSAVGLQGHWRAFSRAGFRPLVLGFATWVTVAGASLAIQRLTGRL
jgi:uncharacterized integral membrane protein (TIGR00698 family)